MTKMYFEKFCAECALTQRRAGYKVPAASSDSVAYAQWMSIASERYDRYFHKTRCELDDDEPVIDCSSKQPRLEVNVDDVLARSIADEILQSLHELCAESVPAVDAPKANYVTASARGSTFDLCINAEMILRLALAAPKDDVMTKATLQLLPDLRTLEKRGVVTYSVKDSVPLKILLDLYGLRTIIRNWNSIDVHTQRKTIQYALELCAKVCSPIVDAGFAKLARLRLVTGQLMDDAQISAYDNAIATMSRSVPYAPGQSCRDGVYCITPFYGEPDGELVNSSLSSTTTAAQVVKQQPDIETHSCPPTYTDTNGHPYVKCVSDDNVSTATSLRQDNSSKTAADSSSHHAYGSSSSSEKSALHSRATTKSAAMSERRECCSIFHDRYASVGAHASRSCCFCASCHLMEILFNGCTKRCAWGHWPTLRKIRYHLHRFPLVSRLAAERLEKLMQGLPLEPMSDECIHKEQL